MSIIFNVVFFSSKKYFYVLIDVINNIKIFLIFYIFKNIYIFLSNKIIQFDQ